MITAPQDQPLGYAVAFASVALATWAHAVLQPYVHGHPLYLLLVLPVLITGYFGSTRQSLLATVLAAFALLYFVTEPLQSFLIADFATALLVLLFLITGAAISFLSGRLKASTAEVRGARARLDGALLGGKVGTWAYDAKGNYFVGDANVAKLLSISERAASRASLEMMLQRTHPDEAPMLRELLHQSLSTGTDLDVPAARVFAPDGSIRWVSARGRVERDADGNAISMHGILLDITDRKQVEDELRESAQQLRLITDAMPALISYLDSERRYRFNNKAYETWYGAKPEALYGMPLREFIGEQAYKEVQPSLDEVFCGRATAFEGPLTYPGGQTLHVKASYVPHLADDGSVLGCFVLVEDLTTQQRTEAALRASETRFRTMADQAPVLIWLADRGGECTWFNRLWTEFIGRPMTLDLGVGWLECLHPEDRERVRAEDHRTSNNHEPFVWEYRLRRHDGEYRWVIDHGVPMHDDDGNVTGFIGSCIDITERRRIEEALRDADRRKDEFLATLAHELRNPLAPIRQAALISRSGQVSEAQLRWSHEVIERQVQHMALLLDDLLDVSRITRGTLALRRQPLKVQDAIHSALETARPLIDARRHCIELDLPAEPIELSADPLRLAQVLANILTNAAKYTEAGGEIRVYALAEADEVVIGVRDSGVGIAPQMLPRVFEMFSQVRSTLQHAEGGLGIGLALARGLVELHDGRIEAFSEGLGRGSEFRVRLPLTCPLSADPESSEPPFAANDITQRRVLIADDNRDAADSLSLLLSLDGHEVRTAHDGAAALAEAEGFRPDVALLDIGMPELSGYEVARELRRQPWARGLVLIAITGWGQEQDRRRSREAGFDHHLTKPVDPAAIAALLQCKAPATVEA